MKKIIKLLKYIYFAFLILFCFLPFCPEGFWWLANLFQIAPLWVLFFPLYALYILDGFRKQKGGTYVYIIFSLVILIGIMGFQVNPRIRDWSQERSQSSVRVFSMNIGFDRDIGQRIDMNKLIKFIGETNPDIITLQEVGDPKILKSVQDVLPNETWYGTFEKGFTLISKFKIKDSQIRSRGFFNDGGSVVGKHELISKDKSITFFNVHLDTPRWGVEAILSDKLDAVDKMKIITARQERESASTSAWASSSQNVIVSGDFNMRDVNPIYRTYWSKFSNAFSKVGFGLGYTKYTRRHGVRIDHVLFDSDWKAIKAYVGPDLNSDHRPLVVDLEFVGEKKVAERIQAEELPAKDYFALEQFETTLGRFKRAQYQEIKIDAGNTYLRGSSLKIQSLPTSKTISVAVDLADWNLADHSNISFSYRIPKDTPVALRVKTRFDDLICLGGTTNSQCPDTIVKHPVNLIDDDEWHEVNLNVGGYVREILPELKYMKEFQFYIHENRHLGDKFWIDDFRVW